jgi:hypothetical protein
MKIHLYVLCYRYEALVASQLEPEAFGRYMAVGTQKNVRGNVLFFEISYPLQSDYFRLENLEAQCTPHIDGTPKRSKYVSIYRVLEHLDLSVFGKLYLCTADGRIMSLEATTYDGQEEERGPNMYEELCPVYPLIVTALGPATFCKFMTDPNNPMSVPRLFFVDMLLERDANGMLAGYLPYPDPLHIVDCIREVERSSEKKTKTVLRAPRLHGFFRTIRRGFFLGDPTGMKFYRFPDRRELEVEHAKWWRSASESLIA